MIIYYNGLKIVQIPNLFITYGRSKSLELLWCFMCIRRCILPALVLRRPALGGLVSKLVPQNQLTELYVYINHTPLWLLYRRPNSFYLSFCGLWINHTLIHEYFSELTCRKDRAVHWRVLITYSSPRVMLQRNFNISPLELSPWSHIIHKNAYRLLFITTSEHLNIHSNKEYCDKLTADCNISFVILFFGTYPKFIFAPEVIKMNMRTLCSS